MQGFGSIEEHGLHVSRLRRGRLGGHIAFHDGHVVDFHNINIPAVVVTEGDVDALALKIVRDGQNAAETLPVAGRAICNKGLLKQHIMFSRRSIGGYIDGIFVVRPVIVLRCNPVAEEVGAIR